MADYRAIETVSKALVHFFRTSYRPEDFDDLDLQFEVYVAEDFKQQPMSAGISVFLYRATVNGAHRTPPGRVVQDGRRQLTQLPLDLHYLLTIWSLDWSLEHRIAAWMMRTLDDTPILPFGLLDAVSPGVFRPDETVEIVMAEMVNEDLLRIWETLVQSGYKLSLPYTARNLRIESRQTEDQGDRMQERTFRMQ